jgi:hypothetical protein
MARLLFEFEDDLIATRYRKIAARADTALRVDDERG